MSDSKTVNRFEAVVVYCNQSEYSSMKNLLARFESCPIVIFVGDCKPDGAYEMAKCFPDNSPEAITSFIKSSL